MTSAQDVLELSGIGKRWNGRPVLDGIDLGLAPGGLVRVVGANGAGKTTLLRIAAGLIRPDGGTVRLRGLDPERDRHRFLRRLGYLSAGDGGLYPRLTARAHLVLCADLALLGADERRAAVDRAIAEFALERFADQRMQRMSTGQRQRTRLALAFIHAPDLVLLDEPANSLDDDGLAIVARALHDLKERGGAAIWCTPSTAEPEIEFDRRYVLSGAGLRPE